MITLSPDLPAHHAARLSLQGTCLVFHGLDFLKQQPACESDAVPTCYAAGGKQAQASVLQEIMWSLWRPNPHRAGGATYRNIVDFCCRVLSRPDHPLFESSKAEHAGRIGRLGQGRSRLNSALPGSRRFNCQTVRTVF
jgi:hypothetical protein